MRRTATIAIALTLAMTSTLAAQAPAPAGPPHAWLFGSWVGGIFPPPVTLSAQECLAQRLPAAGHMWPVRLVVAFWYLNLFAAQALIAFARNRRLHLW